MFARRQIGVATAVAAAALAVLLVVDSSPIVDTSHDRPRLPVAVELGSSGRPLTVHEYAVWTDANGRFSIAAHAFEKALGACRMRLGSFQACALPAVNAMAYEERNAANVATTYQHHPGSCGRALRRYRTQLVYLMSAATAFSHLPHGNPMSALNRLEGVLQESQVGWNQAVLRVRGDCRPG